MSKKDDGKCPHCNKERDLNYIICYKCFHSREKIRFGAIQSLKKLVNSLKAFKEDCDNCLDKSEKSTIGLVVGLAEALSEADKFLEEENKWANE